MKDLYETLGVDRSASTDEIRKAYRKKAKKAHPDAGGPAGEFEELALAHTTLIDDEKRRLYDTTGFIKGEEDINLEALDLMFSLATSAVIDDPQVDILYAIKVSLAKSRRELTIKCGCLEKGATSLRNSWTGAETVRDYIAVAFDQTREKLHRREKVYDACWKLLDGAEFAGKKASLADVFHQMNRFPIR